jgi:hypothetical protein
MPSRSVCRRPMYEYDSIIRDITNYFFQIMSGRPQIKHVTLISILIPGFLQISLHLPDISTYARLTTCHTPRHPASQTPHPTSSINKTPKVHGPMVSTMTILLIPAAHGLGASNAPAAKEQSAPGERLVASDSGNSNVGVEQGIGGPNYGSR